MKTFQVLLILAFLSCNTKTNEKIEREGEPDIISVEGDDKVMNAAIEKSKQTFVEFEKALRSGDEKYRDFSIKQVYDAPEDRKEHLWIYDITFDENNYYGIVGNLPEWTKEVNIGDSIKIEKEKITDWMYIENDILRGGNTIRVLRDRMPEQERKNFDLMNDFKIE